MDPDTQAALTEFIGKINNGLDETVAFGQQQSPDIIQQLLMWHFIESLIYFSLCLILSAMAIGALVYIWTRKPTPILKTEIRYNYKKYEQNFWFDSDGDRNDYSVIGSFIVGTALLFPFAIMFGHLDWLKIWLAPKLYLLEYAADLIK